MSIFETVETINGKRKIRRIKTSVIIFCGLVCIPIGLILVLEYEKLIGGVLVITVAPCLILYPLIRFFFFGGKDSVAAVVATVVVEETIKHALTNSGKRKKRGRY